MRIDEHILAAYIAGELTEDQRSVVTQELIQDRQLREWLHLATEALAAAADVSSQGPKLRLLESNGRVLPNRLHGDRDSIPQITHVRRAI